MCFFSYDSKLNICGFGLFMLIVHAFSYTSYEVKVKCCKSQEQKNTIESWKRYYKNTITNISQILFLISASINHSFKHPLLPSEDWLLGLHLRCAVPGTSLSMFRVGMRNFNTSVHTCFFREPRCHELLSGYKLPFGPVGIRLFQAPGQTFLLFYQTCHF